MYAFKIRVEAKGGASDISATKFLGVGCIAAAIPTMPTVTATIDAASSGLAIYTEATPPIPASFLAYCAVQSTQVQENKIDNVAHSSPLATLSGCSTQPNLNLCLTINLVTPLTPGKLTFSAAPLLTGGVTAVYRRFEYTVRCSNSVIITPTIASGTVFNKP